MVIEYGFMDLPDLSKELENSIILDKGIVFKPNEATFFMGRDHILSSPRKGMAIWRENLFSLMSRNSQSANSFFKLPRDRVIKIGPVIKYKIRLLRKFDDKTGMRRSPIKIKLSSLGLNHILGDT